MKYCLLVCFLCLAQVGQSQDHFTDAFLAKWDGAKTLTLAYAESMPAELYDFRPTDDEQSFAQVLIHMMQNMLWLSTDYLQAQPFEHTVKTARPSKDVLIPLLASAFEHARVAAERQRPSDLRSRVDFFAGEMTLYQILLLMDDHVTHHRGQLAVYLRLNKIKPPRYRGW